MKYDAFISYRHTEPDMYIAKKVHKGLETLKVPRGVTSKSGKKKIERVFRDQEELPIGSDLGDNIRTALEESEYLIVVCSPRTPESTWVQKEIDTFISLHGRERILAILVEGEPQDAFPEKIQVDEEGNPVEPLAADVRGATKREMNRKLRTELIRLAAPLLHCSYDDLRQRHRERRMKKVMFAASAVAVAGVLFGVYSAYNTAMIRENYRQKQVNQSKYLASTSLSLLEEGDRQTAALVAMEALPTQEEDRPYVASAQYALSAALCCYDMGNSIGMDRSLKHDLSVREFAFDDTGERILSIDQGGTIYVWNVEDGALLAKLAPKFNENGYLVPPIRSIVYGEHILICDKDEIRSVTFTGDTEWQVETDAYLVYCEMDAEAGIITCISNSAVDFYDITTGKKLASMENGQESAYGSAYAFSDDKSKFAVSHSSEGDIGGRVTVYDFDEKTWKDYAVEASYVSEVGFSADGGLIAVSINRFDSQKNSIGDLNTGFVEKIDCESGERIWMQEFEYQVLGLDTAGAKLQCRKYQDKETGIVYDQVLLSIDQSAYTWDAATGELAAQIKVTGGIKAFRVATNSCYGYLAESNGTIDIADMSRGINYTTLGIETGKNVLDMSIKNGVLVVRAYASPVLTVMKYHEGYGRKEILSVDNTVQDVVYSPEETYYAVSISELFQQETICFYRTEDDSPVGEWICAEEQGYHAASGFLDETHYVYIDTRGVFTIYDVETAQTEQMKIDMDGRSSFECDWNGSLALLYDMRDYYVVDLQQRKQLYSGDVGEYINCGILSGDGRKMYCNLKDSGLCMVDVSSGSVEPLDMDGGRLVQGVEAQSAMALCADGRLLAAACADGNLRVLDVEKREMVTTIPFANAYSRFIRFSGDGNSVMMQGDDYYFRVYDLQKQCFSHIAPVQYYEIKRASVDEESGAISLVTTTNMVILDGESYERVAQVDRGLAYLPKQGAVFSKNYRTLYRFPYMTLDMLLDEARTQFGDVELTQLERTQYNVD
ncbi:MAG: toll/interleukin-1 receptor domain-containing protein [Acetatifactor sp.]|nr:toll/interleukin-1 receptor domain-containing protein [Acetatifactor sp.]